jgi:mannose-1-phosphate guanylyltransferase
MHQPEMAAACHRWFEVAGHPQKLATALNREYPVLKKISIDYALLEKAHNVVVADGAFAWDDVGAWPALMRHLPPDADGNCVVGECLHVDAARNLNVDGRRWLAGCRAGADRRRHPACPSEPGSEGQRTRAQARRRTSP